MNVTKGEVITLTDNKDYVVVDIVIDNGNKYIYLVTNVEKEADIEVLLLKEVREDNNVYYDTVTDENEIFKVMGIIVRHNKES
jgi:hypothetical protein